MFNLDQITNCRKQALTEVREFLMEIVISKIPQLHMVNVWVPNGNCASIDSELSCMELALSTRCIWQYMPTNWVHWIHVHTRKGVVGIVLASDNKSCFFQDLSNFSIIDQPLAHYERRERRDVCLQFVCKVHIQGTSFMFSSSFSTMVLQRSSIFNLSSTF